MQFRSGVLGGWWMLCVWLITGCGGKQAPDVWSVAPACGQPNRVWVQYATGSDRDPLNQASAETVSNYTVSGLSVTNAKLYSSDQAILLTLSGNLTQATEINVSASNIKDTANRSQSPSTVTLPAVYHATQQGVMGLYYRNKNLAGSLERTAVDANIDFDVGSGSVGTSGPDNFSVRWYSFVEVFQAGDYGLRATTDDGVRVWFQDIDGDPVIDEWSDGSATYTASDTFTATAQDVGKRLPIVMEYYEDKGNAKARLQWDTPASGFVTIPSNRMYTCIPAPASLTLASYAITVPATASTCASASISITARDSTGATLTSYTGTMTITTSSGHGDWSVSTGAGTLNNGSADDGSATYTFVSGDNGTVTLSLENRHADTLRITASEASSSVSNQSTNITFSENAFVLGTNDALGSDVIAGRDHGLLLQFVRRPPSGAQCQVDTGYTGNKNLKIWRTNSSANATSAAAPVVSSGGVSLSVPATTPASNNATGVVFTAGQASLALVTTDVGQYALNVRDDSSGYAVDINNVPVVVNGSSATLTVRPFGLQVTATTLANGANPAASDHTGGVFVSAGTPFNLTVTGVRYQNVDDDSPLDGIPDGHNDNIATNNDALSDNQVVASFGSEQASPQTSVALSANLINPSAGATAPSLAGTTSVSSFTPTTGSGTVQSRYDEVGVIEIRAQISNYLGTARPVYGASGNIGRFNPAWFEVTDAVQPTLAHGHGTCSFTYQGETVAYQQSPMLRVTAKNAQGATTNNYGNSFWKLSLPAVTLPVATLSNLPANSTTSLTRNTDASVYTWSGVNDYDGQATMVLGGDTYTFNKHLTNGPSAGDVVFTPKLSLLMAASAFTDTDGVCYLVGGVGACSAYTIDDADNAGFAGTELRYARLRLNSATGTHLTPALVPAVVEHWTSVGANQSFVTSTQENAGCAGTTLNTSSLTLDNYQGALSTGEVTPQFNGISAGGEGIISLAVDASANPADVSGLVRITVTVPTSLQYNQAGSGLTNPSAIATFGVYGGRAPIFNIQEGYR